MLTKIDVIVREIIADKGYNTLHKYIPYLNYAFRGMEEWMKEGVYTDLRTTKKNLSKRLSLPFPKDMVMWNKVGVVINGRVNTFIRDESISLSITDHPNENVTPNGVPIVGWDRTYDFTEYTNIWLSDDGAVTVLGKGTAKYFTVNYEQQEFQFVSDVNSMVAKGTEIYLEYVSNGFNPSTETLINVLAKNMIKEYINYAEAKFKFGSAAGETRARLEDYLHEQDELRASLSDISGNSILDAQDKSMTRISINQ